MLLSIAPAPTKSTAPVPHAMPLLVEGQTYRMEIISSQRVVKATLSHVADMGAKLGVGYSFLIGKRRQFIYANDLRPGPDGMLIAQI